MSLEGLLLNHNGDDGVIFDAESRMDKVEVLMLNSSEKYVLFEITTSDDRLIKIQEKKGLVLPNKSHHMEIWCIETRDLYLKCSTNSVVVKCVAVEHPEMVNTHEDWPELMKSCDGGGDGSATPLLKRSFFTHKFDVEVHCAVKCQLSPDKKWMRNKVLQLGVGLIHDPATLDSMRQQMQGKTAETDEEIVFEV